jgi:hypothetical protein
MSQHLNRENEGLTSIMQIGPKKTSIMQMVVDLAYVLLITYSIYVYVFCQNLISNFFMKKKEK